MAKVTKFKDRQNNILLPVTRATLVEMNNGDSVQMAYEGINLTHYTKDEINAAGYLQSFTETDPTVPSYVKNITEADITNWNNKLDTFTETDPTIPSYVRGITQADITNWNNKLSEHQDLSSYVNTSYYDVDTKKIYLSHNNDVISEIDTSYFAVETAVEIEYNDLVQLRNNSELTPGTWYRITDYNCTTTQEDTQSAGHQFDIIVLATSENQLSEQARAVQHDNDTYFDDSDLNAWKVWYCLDNDTTRFAWACDGIDENVTVPYITSNGDSFNTKYERYPSGDTTLKSTRYYAWKNNSDIIYTKSDPPVTLDDWYSNEDLDSFWYTIPSGANRAFAQSEVATYKPVHQGTNLEGHGVIYRLIDEWNNDCPYDFKNILFDSKYTFTYNNTDYSLNSNCHDNKISQYISSNVITLSNNIFNISSNTADVHSNIFGTNCYNNTFNISTGCYNNTFGNDFYGNSFGNMCCSNTFKNVNTEITAGNNFYNNIFGNNSGGHTFGDNCQCNIFGNYCSASSFGDNCQYNVFTEYCTMSSFGNNCKYNSIGKSCLVLTFANNCMYNTIGDYCSRNTLAKDYTRYVKIESGNTWTTVTSSATTSSSNYLQNIVVCSGVNSSGTAKTITHPTLNDNFQTIYRNNETGTMESGIVALKSDLANINLTSYVSKAELNSAGYLTSFTEADPIYSASAAAGITSSDITNWNSKTSNVGTITGINMNGASKGTSGVVDLGTVLTEHQSLSSYANAIEYNSSEKKIYLKHDSTTLGNPINATDFIKDGMVETAYVQGGNLIISFNTDAGKSPVSIPVTDIFNANNYYTKTEINNAGYLTSFTETDPTVPSYVKGIKQSDITNWNSKTDNVGTITGITMNGSSKGTSGVVNLGTVVTVETDPTVPSYIKGIKQSDITNWNSKTDNVGTITGITMNGASKGTSGVVDLGTVVTSETDPIYSASAAAGITSTDISNWNSKTDNVGTITGITMNGSSKGTSGVVNLGTVITSETQLSKGTTTGSGNAVTDISVSNHQITLTKGSTFLTSHQDIKTINNQTITGTGNVTINELPTVSSTDNGKVLQVVNGQWQLVTPLNLYSGTGAPDNSQGNNGDIYLQI